jgi:hypothetical protein
VHRTHGRRVHDYARQVDLLVGTQLVQHQAVELVPDAGSTPLVQTVPKSHTAAAHLVGKILPGDAGFEHEQNAGEADAIWHTRFADSRHIRMLVTDHSGFLSKDAIPWLKQYW